jgi:hypothetical protein
LLELDVRPQTSMHSHRLRPFSFRATLLQDG